MSNEQARSEIASFLQAVQSYPDRFAKNPRVTFDQHCSRLLHAAKQDPRRTT